MSFDYQSRHIGIDTPAREHMLEALGFARLTDLIDAAVPESVRSAADESLIPPAATEEELLAELATLSERNNVRVPMMGRGYYRTHTPAVLRRNVLENPAWYTAYTPYQPEISQGRLEALLVFQTMVADLAGLKTANASLLDEPTAAAEAMAMSRRISKNTSTRFLVSADTHPQTIAVLHTRAEPIGLEIELFDPTQPLEGLDYFGILISYPGTSGAIPRGSKQHVEAAHDAGAVVSVASDLLALTLLTPPGEWGADIVVGSAQRFGIPLGFGGPHAGFMAVREGLERNLPGRLVGVSTDPTGQPAYRLALQTREQHIRRERATSNICTSQVLLAVTSAFYGAYHGPDGLREIAHRVNRHAVRLTKQLGDMGVEPVSDAFFDTMTFALPGAAAQAVKAIAHVGIDVLYVDVDHFSVSIDETTTSTERDAIVAAVAHVAGADIPRTGVDEDFEGDAAHGSIPVQLHRSSQFMTHPWFHRYHSETAMMRWLRRLSDFDLALDRTMIPLGSCTMKLNAAAAMEPISLPGFADIHPFAPRETVTGYLELIDRLATWLADITGYAKVSLTPNAGSQGEFAGLMAIRGYHRSKQQSHRDVCLIPASAHGTNAASAVMAGMRVVVVACDDTGGVDLIDLREKVARHRHELAALMVTYPSTYGVYEDTISEVCELVHDAGGQVYIDGANLNALVGIARPGKLGADVSHLNLHKTFCIPHGGGGPGVGPVGVGEHLVPFLPTHPLSQIDEAEGAVGAITGAPFGSAGILPIPYAYIRMMGPKGLKAATENAVLAANYVARRLGGHYPILYTGNQGLVAHECVLDIRDITRDTSVTVDDIAKRLVDYGFHAPTMSFPIAGTLMVEPTESEDLAELDRFCDAMIAIRSEIAAVQVGTWGIASSPLRNAPHTAAALLSSEWDQPYSREVAAYPDRGSTRGKYWPPVGRVDGAHGDRNLNCSCPPIESFQ